MSVDLGELTGVIGEFDIGSHMTSMHRFYRTCKISYACQIEYLHAELSQRSRVRRRFQRFILRLNLARKPFSLWNRESDSSFIHQENAKSSDWLAHS